MENIPSIQKSQYSQEKYQFFLDAPFEISNQCCNRLKKEPVHTYHRLTGRNPIIATMASESRLRTQKWLQNGCNGFDLKIPTSTPMAFWTEQDVLLYISMNRSRMIYAPYRIMPTKQQVMRYGKRYVYRTTGATAPYYPKEYREICSVYGDIVTDFRAMGQVEGQLSFEDCFNASQLEEFELDKSILKTTGCSRTGCVLCGFGCHLEKEGEGRFEMLKQTHPKFHNLLHILKNNRVTYAEAIDWVNEHGNLNIKY